MGERRRSTAPPDLAEFCRREHPRLVRLLSLYCGDAALAEELAQEALIKLCTNWQKVRKMDNPRAWLHRVGMNASHSIFRRRAAEKRAKDRLGAQTKPWHDDPDAAGAVAIRQAVAALPQRQKTVLMLHYFDDLPYAEIAALLNCPENTVKSLARRALASLRGTSGHDLEVSNAF